MEAPVRPTVRQPLPDLVCILSKTPYLENLTTILEKSLKRPPTIYNQQRHMVSPSNHHNFQTIIFLS